MCNFKSAIVLKEPRNKGGFQLLMSPWTESHSDLIIMHKLKDDGRLKFARVEFSPPSMSQAHLPDTYKLKIDEIRTPEWFTTKMKGAVADKMRDYIKTIIVSGDVALLIGGQFVLAPGAKVECAKTCVINAMISANVGVMRESSKVGEMWGSSKVGEMWGSSKVGVMLESSKVGVMRESSNVGEMWGSSKVGVMLESSNVGVMRESSNVGVMRESSKVNNDFRKP